ncbi:MAG: pyrimidine-nucleoside phosphorylase [Clostridia bacterium]|jgi:pyrimidine-nucleoside phosphorylase|nr:pyrimidine-nucleoside phosphorylase [Clostridia bacterium]
MRVVDLIVRKRNGEVLQQEEIETLITAYVEGQIPDYQMAALCMAIYFQGMNTEEVANLTMAMAKSGEFIDLSDIEGIKVDKHSTGGVADTTTLILGPLVAAAGVPVAKMSGRGLGHTGGTIDKLESIPGFKTSLSRADFIKQVNQIKLAVVGQSGNLVPADKKIYSLRDVTGTVPSIPLIASSIMSKKIAAGANKIVLDVKLGSGAFMKNKEDAFALARTMVNIGEEVGRETVAFVTNMDEPLGTFIGNALEVKEAILTLQGKSRGPLRELCLNLGAYMLSLANQVKEIEEGKATLEKLLDSGAALERFAEMVAAQGGNPEIIRDLTLLPQAKYQWDYHMPQDGYIHSINAETLGIAAMTLGAGRENKDSSIDLAVGIKVHARKGERRQKGQPLLTFFYNEQEKFEAAKKMIPQVMQISATPPKTLPLIYGIVTKEGCLDLNCSF